MSFLQLASKYFDHMTASIDSQEMKKAVELGTKYKQIFSSLQDEAMFNQELLEALRASKVKNKVGRITVVGCGGTGSWLMPKLIKTINDAERKGLLSPNFSLCLIDADVVEDKNIVRQNFVPADVGKNKAEVMALRYGGLINKNFTVTYIDKYLSSKKQIQEREEDQREFFIDYEDIINSKSYRDSLLHIGDIGVDFYDHIIFNLVDNMKARQTVHEMAKLCNVVQIQNGIALTALLLLNNVYVIDTGNDLYNGQFLASRYSPILNNRYFKTDNQEKGAEFLESELFEFSQTYFHDNKDNYFSDEDVSLYSCAEADVDIDNQDQMLVANDFAATICHNWFINYLLKNLNMDVFNVQKESSFICGTSSQMETKSYLLSRSEFAFMNLYDFVVNGSRDTNFLKNINYKLVIEDISFYYRGPINLRNFQTGSALWLNMKTKEEKHTALKYVIQFMHHMQLDRNFIYGYRVISEVELDSSCPFGITEIDSLFQFLLGVYCSNFEDSYSIHGNYGNFLNMLKVIIIALES